MSTIKGKGRKVITSPSFSASTNMFISKNQGSSKYHGDFVETSSGNDLLDGTGNDLIDISKTRQKGEKKCIAKLKIVKRAKSDLHIPTQVLQPFLDISRISME
jgi:hypothetical protein